MERVRGNKLEKRPAEGKRGNEVMRLRPCISFEDKKNVRKTVKCMTLWWRLLGPDRARMGSLPNASRKVSKCSYFEKLLASIDWRKLTWTSRPSEECLYVMKASILSGFFKQKYVRSNFWRAEGISLPPPSKSLCPRICACQANFLSILCCWNRSRFLSQAAFDCCGQ